MDFNFGKKTAQVEDTKVDTGKVSFVYDDGKKKSFFDIDAIKAYAVLIISITVISGVTLWVIIPQFGKLGEISKSIETKESELAKLQNQADYLESLSRIEDQLTSNVDTAKLAMADEESAIPYILDQVIQISERSGVDLEGLSLGGVSVNEETGLNEVRISTKISGTYNEIMDYLDKVQNAQRLLDVKNASITINYDTEDTETPTTTELDEEIAFLAEEELVLDQVDGIYNLTLSLSSYYLIDRDVSNLSAEQMVQDPQLEGVLSRIANLEAYQPNTDAINQEIGKNNPFQIGEIDQETGEFIDDGETETSRNDNDNDGFE